MANGTALLVLPAGLAPLLPACWCVCGRPGCGTRPRSRPLVPLPPCVPSRRCRGGVGARTRPSDAAGRSRLCGPEFSSPRLCGLRARTGSALPAVAEGRVSQPAPRGAALGPLWVPPERSGPPVRRTRPSRRYRSRPWRRLAKPRSGRGRGGGPRPRGRVWLERGRESGPRPPRGRGGRRVRLYPCVSRGPGRSSRPPRALLSWGRLCPPASVPPLHPTREARALRAGGGAPSVRKTAFSSHRSGRRVPLRGGAAKASPGHHHAPLLLALRSAANPNR